MLTVIASCLVTFVGTIVMCGVLLWWWLGEELGYFNTKFKEKLRKD